MTTLTTSQSAILRKLLDNPGSTVTEIDGFTSDQFELTAYTLCNKLRYAIPNTSGNQRTGYYRKVESITYRGWKALVGKDNASDLNLDIVDVDILLKLLDKPGILDIPKGMPEIEFWFRSTYLEKRGLAIGYGGRDEIFQIGHGTETTTKLRTSLLRITAFGWESIEPIAEKMKLAKDFEQ
ncbi:MULTISPECIES: hypothetical protein [Pseudomonas]|uniref:hypothetical protein n=1 Tax=Pseudomonas TaxID=286 RepID=UPI000F02754C|nr:MULTISPECIES: hypothetical protein [Pseudomonas]MBD8681613.1 hypothetical protein [Pseudomonas sp. CFBP 13719]